MPNMARHEDRKTPWRLISAMGKWFPMLGRTKGKPQSQTGGFLACSDCFNDQGLRLDAGQIGIEDSSACPRCGKTTGRKLNRDYLEILAHRFLHDSKPSSSHFVPFWTVLERFWSRANRPRIYQDYLVLPVRIELTTSPLPRE
jgi:hypothetical protein